MILDRAIVLALLCAPLTSASDVTYRLSVTPHQPALGEEITASLECVVGVQPARQAVTFDHASLTLVVQPRGEAEPAYAFPNRRVLTDGDLLIREAASGGLEHLEPGERRSRSLELTRLFPQQLLDVGKFEVSYTVYDGTRVSTSPVVRLRVTSSSASVERLLARLQDSELAVRRRAAALLHRMTAREFAFDAAADPALRQATLARWMDWWRVYGSRMKWEPATDGVMLTPTAAPRLHGEIGAVVYPRRPLAPEHRSVWIAVLRAWVENPSPASLQAKHFVADRQFSYSSDDVLLSADAEMLELLTKAIARIPMTPDGAEATLVLLSTVAKMPDPALAAVVSKLSAAMPQSTNWSQARTWAGGLLDLLAPDLQVQ